MGAAQDHASSDRRLLDEVHVFEMITTVDTYIDQVVNIWTKSSHILHPMWLTPKIFIQPDAEFHVSLTGSHQALKPEAAKHVRSAFSKTSQRIPLHSCYIYIYICDDG